MKHLRIFNSMSEFESTKPYIDTPFVALEKSNTKGNLFYEPEIPNYLCFEAIGNYANIYFMTVKGISPNLEYAIGSGEFTDYTFGNMNDYDCAFGNRITINAGEKVYFRGDNSTFSKSNTIYCQLCISSGKINISGNILSLLSKDLNPIDTAPDWCFYNLFSGCDRIISAKDLILPFNKVGKGSYSYMFDGCNSLVSAPELPATKLENLCYQYMFKGCTSLTQAPALPATTLAERCYNNMFNGCSSLTQAPALPATTLANGCYYYMFDGCTSLTQSPELPATTLADSCYDNMFKGCTSLTQAPALPATTLASTCYYYMFDGCTSLTQSPELPATTLAGNCYRNMFNGCTSLTQAPEILPATTLALSCYDNMFKGCTSLTQAPELPAAKLAESCYRNMFYGCSSLSRIKCLCENYRNYSYMNYFTDWVNGVASSGTFIKSANATHWSTGTNGIPEGWTIEDEP